MVYINAVNSLLQKWKMQTKSNHGQICHYVAMRNSHIKKFKWTQLFQKMTIKKTFMCVSMFVVFRYTCQWYASKFLNNFHVGICLRTSSQVDHLLHKNGKLYLFCSKNHWKPLDNSVKVYLIMILCNNGHSSQLFLKLNFWIFLFLKRCTCQGYTL